MESTKLKNIVEIIQKNCISKERKTNGAVFWKKHKKQIPAWIRAGIQLLFFVFFPSAFTAAFSGVKYIAGQMGTGAQIEITSFVLSLIILCASTVVFGRFFCGFACAFGSLSDWVRAAYVWVCKKLKKKPVTLGMELTAALSLIKYAVLLLILFLCFGGTYVKLKGSSPWDVFSMLHAGNFALEGYFAGSSCSFSSCVACACRSVFSAVFCARWERYFHFFRYCHILRSEEKGRTVSLAVQHARKNVPRISDCRNWGRLRREATVLCVRNVPASVRKEISTMVSLEN